MKSELVKGDSLQELKKYDDNSVDLLCTDPPYGYGFMGRDWDKVLPDIGIFEECFRVLKPGSMAFVMSAPRSDVQYRMAEMLERVGFRIDYTPIYWTYATGFPKAMNISKMIDKQKGAKREVTGKGKAGAAFHKGKGVITGGFGNISDGTGTATTEWDEKNNPATDEAKKLDGSYVGFQPKPAVEVVIVAMKPLDKKGYLEQAQDNQKGVTWFDDCRVPFEEGYVEPENQTMPDLRDVGKKSKEAIGIDKLSYGQVQNAKRKPYKTTNRKPREDGTVFKTSGFKSENNDTAEASPMGRFPANLLVSDDVLNDGKITNTNVKAGIRKAGNEFGQDSGWNDHTNVDSIRTGISDSGGYSRYFNLDAWWNKNIKSLPEPVQQTFPFMIVPKASRREKDNGLEFMEEKKSGAYVGRGGSQDDPNGMFKDRETKSRNIHPTVKPLTLMNYLVVLGSRKGDVVLEPFAGSGTTALACVGQERDYIAIEREQEYYEIAKARLEKVEEPLKMWEKFSG